MILEHLQSIVEKITGQEPKTESQEEIPDKIYHGFELPIHYTPLEYIHTLSPIVSSDLELIPYQKNNDEIPCSQQNPKCMYEYLLKPKHDFAFNMISEWNQQYTTYTPPYTTVHYINLQLQ